MSSFWVEDLYHEYPSVPHRPPQFNTRTTPFQNPKSLSSTPKTLQFNTKIHQFQIINPSVQHTPQFHTKNPAVPNTSLC